MFSIGLFFSMLLSVGLSCLFRVLPGVNSVSARSVSMMGCLLMLPTVMMLGRFTVMAGSMRVVFCSFAVVVSCFLRHTLVLQI